MSIWIPEPGRGCYYALTWQQEPAALVLSLAEGALNAVDLGSWLEPRLPLYAKGYPTALVGQFHVQEKRSLGFEGCFSYRNSSNGFDHYVAAIPVEVSWGEGPCDRCEGTGERDFGDGRCPSCRGGGKERLANTKPTCQLVATLDLLARGLELYEGPGNAGVPQLMQLVVNLGEPRRRGVGGGISAKMREWIATVEESDRALPSVLAAMKTVEATLDAKSLAEIPHGYIVRTMEGGRFNLTCEGDACWVGTDGWHTPGERIEGLDLGCHNIDYVSQVLALVGGLAELWRIGLQQICNVEL